MSVRVADRGESKTEYVEVARKLAVDIGKMTANGPNKYRASHADHLNKMALELLMHTQVAHSIHVAKGRNMLADHAQRRKHLKEARGLVDHIGGAAQIYFDLVSACDGFKRDKALARLQRVGEKCARLVKLLGGVMDWDNNHIRKLTAAQNG